MGRIFSYIMENKSHVWNHQPDVKNDHFGVSPLTNPVRCYVFQWVFCPWSPRNRILIWALHDAAFWSKFLVELRGPILENHADFTWSQVWLWRGKFLETPPQEKKTWFQPYVFPALRNSHLGLKHGQHLFVLLRENPDMLILKSRKSRWWKHGFMCLPWPSGVVFTIEQIPTAPACINTEQHLYTLPPKWVDSTQYIAAILIRSPTVLRHEKIENRVNQIPFCFST